MEAVYDHAEAARRRILHSAEEAGALGGAYVNLANLLMGEPCSPTRTMALKKLADSCDSAAKLKEKNRQPRRKPPAGSRLPGQTRS